MRGSDRTSSQARRVAEAMMVALTLTACGSNPQRDASVDCIDVPGQVIRDVDWAPDRSRIGVLGSTGQGEWTIGTVTPADLQYRELARSGDVAPSGMTARSDGIVWQETLDDRSFIVLGGDAGARRSWFLPSRPFIALEATDRPLLALDVVGISDDGDDVDVVEVALGPDTVTSSPIGHVVGAEGLSATRRGDTIAIAGQRSVGGPLVVKLSGSTIWEQQFETGWPSNVAIAADTRRVLIRDVSSTSLLWLAADGSTEETALGDRAVLAFDLADDDAIVFAGHADDAAELCVLESEGEASHATDSANAKSP